MKDLDGNPIDVSVQQDAQGFLLDLFDKMEVRRAVYLLCAFPFVKDLTKCLEHKLVLRCRKVVVFC